MFLKKISYTLFFLLPFVFYTHSSKIEYNQKEISLFITSSDSTKQIIFESIMTGGWEGTAPADSQLTPFKLLIKGNHFYGTIHKISGEPNINIRVVEYKNGSIHWEVEEKFQNIALVILNKELSYVSGK